MPVLCICSEKTMGMGRRLLHWSFGLNWFVMNLQQLSVSAVVVLATEAVVWLPSHVVSGSLYQSSLYHDQLSGMTYPSPLTAIELDSPPCEHLRASIN